MSLFTSPDERGKGYARYLIDDAKRYFVALQVPYLEGNASLALKYAQCHGFELNHAEYRMSCTQCISCSSSLTFQRVTKELGPVFVSLSAEAFGETEESYLGFVDKGLESATHQLYLARKGSEAIGTFILTEEGDDQLGIYCLSVRKSLWGQGLGRAVLSYATEEILKQGKSAVLDVDIVNERALGLYLSVGYKSQYEFKYFLVK